MSKIPAILNELEALARSYSGLPAVAASRLYADLNINGSDFIEFVEEVERRYKVDLSWVSPWDSSAEPKDPTLSALAEDITRQQT